MEKPNQVMADLDWDDIPDAPYYPERSRRMLREMFEKKHPWRMARMSRDLNWLENQMKKMGLNPEDARYLL